MNNVNCLCWITSMYRQFCLLISWIVHQWNIDFSTRRHTVTNHPLTISWPFRYHHRQFLVILVQTNQAAHIAVYVRVSVRHQMAYTITQFQLFLQIVKNKIKHLQLIDLMVTVNLFNWHLSDIEPNRRCNWFHKIKVTIKIIGSILINKNYL